MRPVIWLGPREVAERLGLHPNTVRRIPPDLLPFYRMTVRGDRRYRTVDVERYIASRQAAR